MGEAYKILFLVVILKISAIYVTNANYCNIRSCTNPYAHTLCRFNPQQTSRACGAGPVVGLTATEKQYILNYHNHVRQLVATGKESGKGLPPAAGYSLPNLYWDNTLAAIAQAWANQCEKMEHDQCRDVAQYYVGQNLGQVFTDRLDNTEIKTFLDGWYLESSSLNNYAINNYRDGPWHHYSQMIWAQTTKIGCGMVKYVEPNPLPAPIAIPIGQPQYACLLICNYGTGGNIPGQKVYQVAQLRG